MLSKNNHLRTLDLVSTGIIIAIVISSFVVILLVIFAVYWFFIRKPFAAISSSPATELATELGQKPNQQTNETAKTNESEIVILKEN